MIQARNFELLSGLEPRTRQSDQMIAQMAQEYKIPVNSFGVLIESLLTDLGILSIDEIEARRIKVGQQFAAEQRESVDHSELYGVSVGMKGVVTAMLSHIDRWDDIVIKPELATAETETGGTVYAFPGVQPGAMERQPELVEAVQ